MRACSHRAAALIEGTWEAYEKQLQAVYESPTSRPEPKSDASLKRVYRLLIDQQSSSAIQLKFRDIGGSPTLFRVCTSSRMAALLGR